MTTLQKDPPEAPSKRGNLRRVLGVVLLVAALYVIVLLTAQAAYHRGMEHRRLQDDACLRAGEQFPTNCTFRR